jgi:methionyl-tRNA formyltransferase
MAVEPLRALVAGGFDVALVVTGADTKRGRGGSLSPSPVKEVALDLGLAVSHVVADVLDVGADLGVVVAYGRLVRRPVLEQLAMVNLHFSLLPRWRGAAPVERALLAGDDVTGVCLMQLDEGLDTGPVLATQIVPIAPDVTLRSLRAELVAAGTGQLLAALAGLMPTPVPQHGEITCADKLTSQDHHLDFHQSAVQLDRVVRLGEAWTTLRGRRIKVLQARAVESNGPQETVMAPEPAARHRHLAPGQLDGVEVGTGAGRLVLVTVQPEGRSAQSADAWRNGARLATDDRLGS